MDNAELAALVAADTETATMGEAEPVSWEAALGRIGADMVEAVSKFGAACLGLFPVYNNMLRVEEGRAQSKVLPYPLAMTPDNAWSMG